MDLARKRIGELLLDVGLISREQLQDALKDQQSSNQRLGDVLINNGYITQSQLMQTLELQLGIPRVDLGSTHIDDSVLKLIPGWLVRKYRVVPYRREGDRLYVAMADPLDYYAIDDIQMTTGLFVEPSIAARDEVTQAVNRNYNLQDSVSAAVRSVSDTSTSTADAEIDEADSPVVRLLNQVLADAANRRASDVHIDPQADGVRIRFRLDGFLRTEQTLPRSMLSTLITRVKVLSSLNIAEQRLPQDGRFRLREAGRTIDVRVSTLPTMHGEKAVLRILDASAHLLPIPELGFSASNVDMFQEAIDRPFGLVLITGPTGSGKTTTLYAALRSKAIPQLNVVAIEDPVEIQLPGVNQVQVNQAIALTFARGLRALLRQDPDVVMIGEIRDDETAEIAVRAAVTGHLVLSTVHTNDAASAINRLVDMGVPPYMVASALNAVVAQRLVRRVCPQCAEAYTPSAVEMKLLSHHGLSPTNLRHGRGCGSCANTGYSGRLAIHEVFVIDDAIGTMILAGKSDRDYRSYGAAHGTSSMLTDGLQKAVFGQTTIQEVLRVTAIGGTL